MQKIGLISKRSQAEKFAPIFKQIYRYLVKQKKEIYIERKMAETIKLKKYSAFNRGKTEVDLLIVLGGDGTILSVVRSMGEKQTKIFGINIGRLGFLSEIPAKKINETLSKVLKGQYKIDERMRLCVEVIRNKKIIKKSHALNEATISQSTLARLIQLKTKVNRRKLTTYHADGLIIATPTGSTAYSLSAGGPVIHPTIKGILLTPICPHSFTQKPILIPDNKTIEIKLEDKHKAHLSIDGQEGIELKQGDEIKIYKKGIAKFVRLPSESFFKTVREKLNWGTRNL